MDSDQDHPPMDLTLARAAAAFRDADFFEACVLFWSAVLDPRAAVESEADLTKGLDLEEELGLDVQAEQPFELVFPAYAPSDTPHIDAHTITSIQTYTLTALCYLSRHINVRIDFLPSGRDTLTTLGPPQRYYGALTPEQKELYQQLLAIVLATATKVSQKDSQVDQQHRVQQATILGNEATVIWQTTVTQKQAPHNLPRFFSFLNPNSCTVAGCSIPRNELDIDALAQNGFRLVITLIRESPLSPTWFLHSDNKTHSIIRNAFVPIENRKAPEYPEVFEILMGWCLRAGASITDSKVGPTWQHQRATLIHCGGGKGRAGIVLAAHLIRYGLAGHDHRGYCAECLRNENVHRYDLEQFRKGLGDREATASTLPEICSFMADEDDTNEDEDEEPDQIEFKADGGYFRVVSPYKCLNRYRPMMTARDAMAHLREIRPGSIESVEQEKAVKAYGDWLWKKSSSGSKRSRAKVAAQESSASVEHAEDMLVTQSTAGPSSGNPDRPKQKKEKKKEAMPKSQTLPPAMADEEGDDFSGDEFGRGRKSGKKGKKNSRKLPQEQPRVFVPPPADKIIKIPGSHHQHHLVVQHNIRARQLQRGQKSKKKNGGGGKQSKERPSYSVSGTPLTSAPKLIILAGLPGSGKSHLAATLLDEFPDHFVRISQDELGSRAVCERLLAQSMRHQQQSLVARGPKRALPMTIVIDRCNPTMAERKEWYEVAFQPDETAMVWFSADLEHCIERVDSRESHPTVGQGMGSKVVRSFAKSFESPSLSKEGGWCKTLIEVGDDDGCDRLLEVMRKFARDIPGSGGSRKSKEGKESTPVKARPAFIPARVLQRKQSGSASPDGDSATALGASSLTSKTLSTGSMASVEEGEEEDDDEDHSDDSEEDDSEDEDDEEEDDETQDDEDDVGQETEAATNDKARFDSSRAASPSAPQLSSLSISKALQFASPTGYRPAVKRPTKGSWKGSAVDTQSLTNDTTGSVSPKGVSFATPLSTFDRPLQKFPRTPHLFDPLTILESWEQNSDRMVEGGAGPSRTGESPLTKGRSSAISRSDLLLPPSAIRQVFAPKPHQVLTIEEKMDGANIGFSVLHFKTMDGFAGVSSVTGPPPKIRVQNRNHFVHPDDHWQFKKLNGWLEKHREDVLWLCEGRWRYETREKQGCDPAGVDQDPEEANEETSDDKTGSPLVPGNDDQDWEDEESDGDDVNEYVDENEVLQDGMAPYVLYGEWLYAKHSVKYTGLRSWFVPFDLLDVKTGTFVSRAVFQNAVAQTHLVPNPVIKVPQDVQGDVEKTLRWTLESLHGRSALMRPAKAGVSAEEDDALRDRVEGLYFRIDQGDRLLMRSKVVRPDFIAGEERWGTKEQVANQLGYHFGGEYENA
ncbi:hypothetical protein KVV02_003504 [Mortierella alpina]|uniref:Tyrosine specific protein phosphatases domain-containing protein n=1 Tax=Mortierella alpina TaxID=64518 RepID=A0A9P8D1J7_MORAP|nr:hypothetical protein KVV02_003504 [Mortierella alpina]